MYYIWALFSPTLGDGGLALVYVLDPLCGRALTDFVLTVRLGPITVPIKWRELSRD